MATKGRPPRSRKAKDAEIRPEPQAAIGAADEEVRKAICAVCGQHLRHAPNGGYIDENEVIVPIPSYHSDCVPKEKQSGPPEYMGKKA